MARGWEEVYRTEHGLRRETGEKLDEARADVQRLRAEWQRDLDSCNTIIDRLKAENERLQRLLDHATQPNPGTSTLVMLMNEASAVRAERDLLKNHYSPEAAAKLRAELASARAELAFLRKEYGEAESSTLTRDALELKLQVMEQQRDEERKQHDALRAVWIAARDWLNHLEQKGYRYNDGVPGEPMDAVDNVQELLLNPKRR